MTYYDATFILTAFDPSNIAQLEQLEALLEVRLLERESLYQGGTYYCATGGAQGAVLLRRNLDIVDMTLFYSEYPEEVWILDLNRTPRNPRDLEKAIRAEFQQVVLHREQESRPSPIPKEQAIATKPRIIIAALPNFEAGRVAALGSALGVVFQEKYVAALGGRYFSAEDAMGGTVQVFENYDDEGELAYPEVPVGIWLAGFFLTTRTAEEIARILTSHVDTSAYIIRAPK
jgi:hypothetical protein